MRVLQQVFFEGCLQRNHHLGRVRPGLGMERKERKMKIKEFKSFVCPFVYLSANMCIYLSAYGYVYESASSAYIYQKSDFQVKGFYSISRQCLGSVLKRFEAS